MHVLDLVTVDGLPFQVHMYQNFEPSVTPSVFHKPNVRWSHMYLLRFACGCSLLMMVQADGWKPLFRKSIRDKVQRQGRNSYNKRVCGATSIAAESWDHRLLNPGIFNRIAQADGEEIEHVTLILEYSILTSILLYYDNIWRIYAYLAGKLFN